MFDFLQQNYYGNPLQTWLISLVVILLSLLLGKVAYWFFSKVVRIFTSRTKTRVDDVIVDRVEEPLVTLLIVTGIWLGLRLLVLPLLHQKGCRYRRNPDGDQYEDPKTVQQPRPGIRISYPDPLPHQPGLTI